MTLRLDTLHVKSRRFAKMFTIHYEPDIIEFIQIILSISSLIFSSR
jgi:hypothetical protein